MILIIAWAFIRLLNWIWIKLYTTLWSNFTDAAKLPSHVAFLCGRWTRPEDITQFVDYFLKEAFVSTVSIYAFDKSQLKGLEGSRKNLYCFLWFEGQSDFLEGKEKVSDLDFVVVHKPVMNIAGIDPLRIRLAEFYRLDFIDPLSLKYALCKYSKTEQRYGK